MLLSQYESARWVISVVPHNVLPCTFLMKCIVRVKNKLTDCPILNSEYSDRCYIQ